MAEAFIVRRGGGGGSGATLVVTSAGTGTVTVSNSTLGKSYSKSVTAGGSAVFKGLKTGTWTVQLSNGAQTSTQSVTINADYSVSIAYFSATINVTYPANSTCVVTNSSGQTVASDTNTGSSTKTFTAIVNATGTYTVTATATDGSEKSKSQSVEITSEGQSESVELSYELEIFANGVINESVTGGFDNSRQLTIVDNNLKIFYSNSVSGNANVTTKNSIDISDYDNVKLDVVSTTNTGNFTTIQSFLFQIIRDNAVLGQVKLNNYKNQTASLSLDEYKSGGDIKFRFRMECNEGGVSAIISRFYLE